MILVLLRFLFLVILYNTTLGSDKWIKIAHLADHRCFAFSLLSEVFLPQQQAQRHQHNED
jgi:hypothetical protein